MKAIRNITIIFTVFMLAALAAFAVVWLKARMSVEITASFSMDDLEAYKNVLEPIKEGFNRGRQELFAAVLVFWGIVLVSGYILIGFVYNLNIKPVEEMEEYASEIAKGNLDVKLPMRRHNIFGGFTESFDMMRDELKTSRKREVEAQKAKRDMVAELSHDLKTPVATIAATCEVLDMKYQIRKKEGSEKEIKDAEDTLEKIGYIKEKSDVITRLVENVFSVTEGEVDEIKVDPQETQSSVIEGFFESYREYANIIFKNHIPQCLVYLDKLRMEQVIDNVIGNSIKYAGTDITVSFDVTEETPDKDGTKSRFLKITIRDEGPGVDEEDLPLIIGKFSRGKNAEDKSGYGLGLYLVNFYMEKQRGGMNYYNDNGFVVELLVRKV
ncbi:MAG: hypothetical protein J5883_01940 [Clostridiales bacterium]|nr:hypothetical protein [Clostridiales bacterium]